MVIALMLVLAQAETTFREPGYFAPVMMGMFVLGAVAWLVAAVLGLRARGRLVHRRDGFRLRLCA